MVISSKPDTTMRHFLATAKAFTDPTRVRVIFALCAEELCVCELCDALGVVQSTLSTHLQYLRQADLVRTRNDAKWVYYSLKEEFARVVAALFKLHRTELEADAQLKTDAARLRKRLALRDDGACCFGFAAKKPVPRRRRSTAKA